MNPYKFKIDCFTDSRGDLCVIDEGQLPFEVKRIYYLFNSPSNSIRGVHGHKILSQIFICFHGSVEVKVYNGSIWFTFKLNSPGIGLYIPPGSWREVKLIEPQSVLAVFASEPYQPEDYLYSFTEYQEWNRTRKKV
jgi:dTDP-4-dehydrorhamnose 3,5-epimerase-like enzyme